MQSKAKTVAEYLKTIPADRRESMERVMKVVRANLDPLLEEGMQYGMIGWYVPHSVFGPGYHCDPKQPLPYACLASQKNYMSLYLMTAYAEGSKGETWIRSAWPKTAKPLDMGKSCIRFKHADDLALDVIGEAVRRLSVADHLAWYAAVDPRNFKKASAKAATTSKPAVKKTAAKKTSAKKAAAKKTAAKKPAKKK
jgi:hypothetical protein